MLFNSYSFIFLFAPLAIAGLALSVRYGGAQLGVLFLGVASLVFYAVGAIQHLPILIGSVVANFLIGERIACSSWPSVAKGWLAVGIAANLTLLASFKYARFGAEALNQITGSALPLPDWALPIGISFYTFTQIAFLVDVHRGIARETNGAKYGLFVTYFPHLIAGPIIHHKQVIPQFGLERFGSFQGADVSSGLAFFAIGLAKKVLVADQVAPYANAVFAAAAAREPLSAWEAVAGLLAYSMQIYFDFSAYSDMAIGLSRTIGIDIPINFNAPYKARSIIEFWRRWHISLSTFLRDYLYIPLGGNRLGEIRRYLNLFVVMLLGGLWHGAGWGFVLWGGLHGIYLICNHALRDLRLLTRVPSILLNTGGWTLTFIATAVAWAFFRADAPGSAVYLLQLATGGRGISLPQGFGEVDLLKSVPVLRFEGMFEAGLITPASSWLIPLASAIILALGAPTSAQLIGWFEGEWRGGATGRVRAAAAAVVVGIVFGVCLLGLHRQSPFLYFNF